MNLEGSCADVKKSAEELEERLRQAQQERKDLEKRLVRLERQLDKIREDLMAVYSKNAGRLSDKFPSDRNCGLDRAEFIYELHDEQFFWNTGEFYGYPPDCIHKLPGGEGCTECAAVIQAAKESLGSAGYALYRASLNAMRSHASHACR